MPAEIAAAGNLLPIKVLPQRLKNQGARPSSSPSTRLLGFPKWKTGRRDGATHPHTLTHANGRACPGQCCPFRGAIAWPSLRSIVTSLQDEIVSLNESWVRSIAVPDSTPLCSWLLIILLLEYRGRFHGDGLWFILHREFDT